MPSTMVCTFCKNKGIPPPHNHTVRNWILPDKPIICPQLLSTQCTYCKTVGHTIQYCHIRNAFVKYSNINDEKDNLKRPLDNFDILPNKLQKK